MFQTGKRCKKFHSELKSAQVSADIQDRELSTLTLPSFRTDQTRRLGTDTHARNGDGKLGKKEKGTVEKEVEKPTSSNRLPTLYPEIGGDKAQVSRPVEQCDTALVKPLFRRSYSLQRERGKLFAVDRGGFAHLLDLSVFN